MIKVMIVEDQKLVRSLFESYIEKAEDYQLVSSIAGADAAFDLCAGRGIDLILLDVQTENRENGLAALRRIKKSYPQIKIIIVTSLLDYEVLQKARENGADSLWYKDTEDTALMELIQRTMAGEHIFPDSPPEAQIGTARSSEFTKMELKVLRCLMRGLSYSKIAEELHIEQRTVQFHVTNMLSKTNFENKLQLALAVSDAKLIVNLSDEDENS